MAPISIGADIAWCLISRENRLRLFMPDRTIRELTEWLPANNWKYIPEHGYAAKIVV
jgi:hypothetical protein